MDNTYDFRVAHPDIIQTTFCQGHAALPITNARKLIRFLHVFSHYNEIAFTLSGKKTLHHRERSWTLTDNTSLFIRRTAYKAEKYDFEGWEILVFCFQDDFLRQVFREHRQYLPFKNLPPPPSDMLIEIKGERNNTYIFLWYNPILFTKNTTF